MISCCQPDSTKKVSALFLFAFCKWFISFGGGRCNRSSILNKRAAVNLVLTFASPPLRKYTLGTKLKRSWIENIWLCIVSKFNFTIHFLCGVVVSPRNDIVLQLPNCEHCEFEHLHTVQPLSTFTPMSSKRIT